MENKKSHCLVQGLFWRGQMHNGKRRLIHGISCRPDNEKEELDKNIAAMGQILAKADKVLVATEAFLRLHPTAAYYERPH